MNTLLTIEGHVYKVTSKFTHPGEGIRDQYIRNYRGKEVSEEFDYYHMTNEPWEILEQARLKGEYKGVIYMGPVNRKDESSQAFDEKEVAQETSTQTEEKEA
jgi:cytochrome b involved in lipid metabolism